MSETPAAANIEKDFFHRLFIGGLGALTPVVAQLLLVDLEHVFTQASGYAVLGYFIRVGLLFGVGVLAVFLDGSEFNRARLFQIGMGAPALLLATMNGAQALYSTLSLDTLAYTVAVVSLITRPSNRSDALSNSSSESNRSSAWYESALMCAWKRRAATVPKSIVASNS